MTKQQEHANIAALTTAFLESGKSITRGPTRIAVGSGSTGHIPHRWSKELREDVTASMQA